MHVSNLISKPQILKHVLQSQQTFPSQCMCSLELMSLICKQPAGQILILLYCVPWIFLQASFSVSEAYQTTPTYTELKMTAECCTK